MAITTSSVQTTPTAAQRIALNGETSFARHFWNDHGVHPSTHWRQIASAAAALNGLSPSTKELNQVDGIASTGKPLTIQHYPWASTRTQRSVSTVASSAGLRFVIRSTWSGAGASSMYLRKAWFNMARIQGVFAQVRSTKTPTALVVGRRMTNLVVPGIAPSNSTVIARLYGSSLAGEWAPSTYPTLVQFLVFGV